MSSRFRRPSLATEGEGLDVRVQEHVERDTGFAVDRVVVGDDELVEEGLGRAIDVDPDALVDTSKSLNEGAIDFPHFKAG